MTKRCAPNITSLAKNFVRENLLLVFLCLTLPGCHEQSPSRSDPAPVTVIDSQPLQQASLPHLDTVIMVSGKYAAIPVTIPISELTAQKILYDFFLKKGVLRRNDPRRKKKYDSYKSVVDFDTIYQIQSVNLSGAVVSYYLGPPDLNGHCFRPDRAIILNTKNGFRITDEEFIPHSFGIDSVKGTRIYGYDYACGGGGVQRQFTVELRRE